MSPKLPLQILHSPPSMLLLTQTISIVVSTPLDVAFLVIAMLRQYAIGVEEETAASGLWCNAACGRRSLLLAHTSRATFENLQLRLTEVALV